MSKPAFASSHYLDLIVEFSKAWFALKDQRSVMGFLWSFLNPLLMSIVLFFIFSQRMGAHAGSDYFLYILTGTVIWNFFIMSTQGATKSLVYRANMVRNFGFPKEVIVFATVGTFIMQFLFEIVVVMVFIIAFTGTVTPYALFFPLVFVIELLIVLALSLFLSSICVFARDLDHIWNLLTRMGFFIVPIFYTLDDVSGPINTLVRYNPLSQIIIMSRQVLMEGAAPDPLVFSSVLIAGLGLLAAGYSFFKRIEHRIVERI